jgi:hypothetical protein
MFSGLLSAWTTTCREAGTNCKPEEVYRMFPVYYSGGRT